MQIADCKEIKDFHNPHEREREGDVSLDHENYAYKGRNLVNMKNKDESRKEGNKGEVILKSVIRSTQ